MPISTITALALIGGVNDAQLWRKLGWIIVPYEYRIGTPQTTIDVYEEAMNYLGHAFERQLEFRPKVATDKYWIHFYADQANTGHSDNNGAASPVSIRMRNSDIVEMDVASGVTAWYSDNSFSTGTVDDPDGESGKERTAVTWPVNPQTGVPYGGGDVVAIEKKSTGRVYAWYRNGYFSSGTSSRPGSVTAPAPFKTGKIAAPNGLTVTLPASDIVGVAFSAANRQPPLDLAH